MSSEHVPPAELKRAANKPLPVPGFWRLGWMLFMQPRRLYAVFASWGFETESGRCDPTLGQLIKRRDEPRIRTSVIRLACLLLVAALIVATIVAAGFALAGMPLNWFVLVVGAAFGVAVGVAVGATFGVAVGVTFGVAVVGVVGGVTFGVALAVALGEAVGETVGVALGVAVGLALGLAVFLGLFLVYLRIPFYLFEALGMWFLSKLCEQKWLSRRRVAGWLPFRHHDFISYPLPGLHSFLVAVGKEDASLAQELIAEAVESIGQRRPAHRAIAELQAWSLERAASFRWWARAAELDLEFLRAIPPPASVRAFQNAARDLGVVEHSQSHHHVQEALGKARAHLEGIQTAIAGSLRATFLERCLLPVARTWLEVVAEEEARLAARKRENPQVPTPFVAGPVLLPANRHLFKGRRDLVRIIDHYLTGDRRPPLLLLGQRRMGKSSLLSMLPDHLGTGTQVIPLSFQGLSGSPYRNALHRWLGKEVAARCSEAMPPPDSKFWGTTMEWLARLDDFLGAQGRRMLVAIDEIERLQSEIDRGRSNVDFLDLVRAMGDKLERVRILLVSAHPLEKLGRDWVDRLISVAQHEISYLEPEEARELICHPIAGFPDIYPPGGVDQIVHETRCHPYLIQLVCDELCKHLNKQKRLKATDEDIEIAIDAAFATTKLFHELWDQQTEAAHDWLVRLAEAPVAVELPDRALMELVRRGFVERRSGNMEVAVPMFATWIRDQQSGLG